MTTANSAPFAKGSDTSEEAASLLGDLARLQAQVLDAIVKRGGATSDEVEEALGLPHQTVSARFWELHRRGTIADSGERRRTRAGRNAAVYKLTKQAKAEQAERERAAREAQGTQVDLFELLAGRKR